MGGGSKGRARDLEKELVSIPAVPGLRPRPVQGSQQSWRKVNRLPAELEVGKTGAGREHSPRRCRRGAKHSTHHLWEAGRASPASLKNAHPSRGGQGQAAAGTARSGSPEGNRAQQEMKNGNAGMSRTGKQQNKHDCGLAAPGARWLRAPINRG